MLTEAEIKGRATCFGCGQQLLSCPCSGKQHGEDVQFYMQTQDLPPRDTSPKDHVDAWVTLVESHPRTRIATIEAKQFVADFFVQRQLLQIMVTSGRGKVVDQLWTPYKASSKFRDLKPKLNDIWTLDQMKNIGDETIDSFFAGRWYEMTVLGCAFFVNAFGASDLDPHSVENRELKVVADAVQVISAITGVISSKPGYTLIAPGGNEYMKQLAVFQPLIDFK
ncbi:hypothetical protein BDR26DRAFT_871086 [Obelidium mucronatum]|nr:hypothetical protein BDR26DRAFT_871086 [Obelidium mucronatum]